jgi:hypothetical protein
MFLAQQWWVTLRQPAIPAVTESLAAKSDACAIRFVEVIQSALLCPSSHLYKISDFQKLSLTFDPNQRLIPRHPVPREGALAIVTDVGAGSGGRGGCD